MTNNIKKIEDWFALLNEKGLLCENYNSKAMSAHSKKQLMDIVLDANGSSYLQEISAKGYGLPYEFICSSFASYINGRYVAEYKNEKGNGYTSKMYCCFDEDTILVDTTLCSVLGYTGRIVIAKNNFAKIYLDKNCDVQIELQDGARGIIEYWKGAKVEVLNMHDKVQLIEN
jgi:hypothetical protein